MSPLIAKPQHALCLFRSSNGTSMWVKISAQWLTMLLFAWSLVAPKLFPSRDFT